MYTVLIIDGVYEQYVCQTFATLAEATRAYETEVLEGFEGTPTAKFLIEGKIKDGTPC